ncbi:DUF11 domain-containing protein [Paenibacillus sp. LHD-38]|uniref:DUF11 domain-containing protein n=1 Tax=Paenibacillus sp. LHD-38 TaxID=3072143 RepID=UPI00280DA81A|nr:DUF11 domain-containing protein [Paenibacillus sp. LHD-38]MDQ8739411.1 DUF11 domain-containing protein [Paenibacillus sp. LHD-38]
MGVRIRRSADLSVTNENQDPVLIFSPLTYTVTVNNNGPSTATGVTLTYTLPTGVTFISATPSQGSCTETGGIVTCSLGTLANGASATVEIVVTPTAAGTITSTATVSGNEFDPDLANNTDTETTTVNPVADLAVTKTDTPDPVIVGSPLTYNVVVPNNGPSTATEVTLIDTLPAGVTFISATPSQGSCTETGGVVTCSLGTLANGASATVEIVVTPTAAVTTTNTASVSGNEFDPDLANNTDTGTTTVNPVADLAVTKTDTPDPVFVGSPLTYNVVVPNNGPSTATGVTLIDTLPAGVTFISANPSQGSCTETGGVVTCSLGTLANGASATVEIVVTPTAAGTTTNTANVSGNEFDPNLANNTDTEETVIIPVPPLCPPAVITCGNGNIGLGSPGERQVNNPAQDTAAPDNNITQSETSLAAFGPFILFGFNDSNQAITDNFSGFAFSSDGGSTWSDCGSMPQNPNVGNFGDPVIAVDSQGVFYYAHLGIDFTPDPPHSFIQISTASVNLLTRLLEIRNPFVAGEGSPGDPESFQDKEWITVGLDPSRPGQQSLYVTWTEFPSALFAATRLRFAKWTTGCDPQPLIASKDVTIGSTPVLNIQGSFPVSDNSGNLYIFYEQFGDGLSISVVKSTDGGQTFLNPVSTGGAISPVIAINTISCNRRAIVVSAAKAIRMNEFPHAAVGPDNTLYVVWNSFDSPGNYSIRLAFSTNGGVNWTVRTITTTTTHEFFPSVAANALGAHIQYNRFLDPDNVGGVGNGTFALFKRSYDRLTDTISPETRLSTADSLVPDTNPNFDSALAGCYMGDYNQIIAGPGTTLLHGWSDNRNGTNGNNPDAFFIQS